MTPPKLIKPLVALLCASVIIVSCEKKQDLSNNVSNYNITLARSNNVPTTVASTGRVEATFDKNTHTLSYKIYWYALSGAPTAIHIHGLADAGAIAPPTPLGLFAGGIAQTITGFPTGTTAVYSGTLYADGILIKESDLLAGQYYFDIHTATYGPAATYPAGELRGQLTFGH